MADKKSSSSFFTRVAVGAPIVGAVGVGVRRFMNSSSTLKSNSGQGTAFLGNFAAHIKQNGAMPFSNDLSIMVGKDPEMIKMAWEMALAQADPGKIIRRDTLDAVNPAATIKFFADSNQSLQGNKVLQSFVKQMGGLELHSQAYGGKFSAAMFGKAKRHNFIRSNVPVSTVEDNILRETLTNIQNTIKQIPGAEMNLKMASREGLDGGQLMLHMSGGKFGKGAILELPMEIAGQQGVIAHGVTQQTKRIVGQYDVIVGNKIQSTLKHEQVAALRFYHEILPQIVHGDHSSSSVGKLVRDFNYGMIEQSQWVANLPKGLLPAHDAAIALGGHRRVLLNSNFERLNAQEMAGVLADSSNGLFPSTSGAQIAKGVASSFNAQKLWFGGEGFGWARRPMQAFGRGFGPSAKSFNARVNSRVRKHFDWLHTSEFKSIFGDNPVDIMGKTTYVSEKVHPKFAEKFLGGELGGAGLYSSILNDQFEHVAPLTESIKPVNQKLLDHINGRAHFSFESPLGFEEGELLGYDKNNHPLNYTPDMKITGGFAYTDRDTQFTRLYGTKTLPVEMHPKVFGSAKAVLQQTPQSTVDDAIKALGGNGGAEVVAGMAELKKNRTLHNIQMFTALQDFTFKQMRSRNGGAIKLEQFNSTFTKSVQEITTKAAQGSIYNPDEVVKGVHQLARQFGLSEHAIGGIFGAVPDVYGDSWKNELAKFGVVFSDAESKAISKGLASGVGTFVYGGPSGSGGLGSVEPRFFELLQGRQFGSLGPRMSSDIAQRMILSNPEMVQEQSILGTALGSIIKGVKPTSGIEQFSLKSMSYKNMQDILRRGGILDTGGLIDGVKNISIPGIDQSIAMNEYTTSEGLVTKSKLHDAFQDFLEVGAAAHEGKATRTMAKGSFNNLVAELGSAYTGTITGKGTGLARSKVMGSRYLKAIPTTAEEMGDLHTIGVNKKHALGMFGEMERTYANDPQELAHLAEQKRRLLAGEAIGAISRRDPEIGPYSAAPVKMKIMARLKETDSMLIPQETRMLSDLAGNQIGPVSMGPMAGFAGDFDDDHAHIMLTSSKIEKDVMGHYSVGTHATEYEDYIIRQQLLKAKAPKVSGISMAEEMISDAQKLAIAKSHVGPLSVPMRELRAALSQHQGKLNNNDFYDADSVLEALEQTPISGKHVPANRIDDFTRSMTQLASAAKAGRGQEMTRILEDTLQHNPQAKKLLSEDQTVLLDGKERLIRKLNLENVGETLRTAYSNYRTSSGDASEGIVRSVMNGTQKMTQKNIGAVLSHGGGLLADFKLSSGQGASVIEQALAAKNKVAAMGGDLISHLGKPLALGFGAALAMSAILSKPISNLDPGSSHAPTPRVNSSNRRSIAPENLHPDSEVTGEPTIPNTMSGPSARYSPDDNSARIHIRGMNRNGANLSSISSAITQRLQGNTNINVNVRDRKSSLDQQKIDSIIRR
jgi:hypothetical protein